MPTEDSLKQSMDRAVKRYSSLFRLPTGREVLLLFTLTCFCAGLVSSAAFFSWVEGLASGVLLGLALLCAGLAADYVTSRAIIGRETIYNLRRTLGLSFFCLALWLFFIILGTVLTLVTGMQGSWIRFCLLGFSVVVMFRLAILSATSSIGRARVFAASILQPFAIVAFFIVLWIRADQPITVSTVVFFPFSLVVGAASVFLLLHSVDRVGKQSLGVQSLSLFRAFMLNWVINLNSPFEQLLEKLGEKRSVEACYAKFSSGSSKAAMVVPSVHPGPFRNIGSSLLPSLLKTAVEKETGCVACVPHGLLGHEFDLASGEQNRKIIGRVVERLTNLEVSESRASPFVKITNGLATACCQVFGRSALISFTLAPRTIEDLPQELGLFVREESRKHGLQTCIVINAHNSIDGKAEVQESLESLKDVARKCLEKAASLNQLPFEVGAGTLVPREFSLEDGMGAGGITVVVVRCDSQKAAYVVIDGNNMVSGLREDILSSLNSMGISEGEVLTTDTHAVSALVLGGHGYHPLGEVIDRKKLIGYVQEATNTAVSRLETSRAACQCTVVNDVTVLGAKQLETLCLLIDRCIHTAKKVVVPIFATAGLLLMLFLLFV